MKQKTTNKLTAVSWFLVLVFVPLFCFAAVYQGFLAPRPDLTPGATLFFAAIFSLGFLLLRKRFNLSIAILRNRGRFVQFAFVGLLASAAFMIAIPLFWLLSWLIFGDTFSFYFNAAGWIAFCSFSALALSSTLFTGQRVSRIRG